MTRMLRPDHPFPSLSLKLPGGRTLRVPDELRGHWAYVAFFRGAWCPYCIRQLAGIQRCKSEFDELGVALVAASADPEKGATELIEKSGATFPAAYGVTPADAEVLGAWVGEREGNAIIQPCEFVIRPDGTVAASMYASVQLGRMDPREVLRFVRARICRRR